MCICLLFLLFQALQSFPHYYVLFLNSHWQIYFLPSLQGINGILADEMGLGKTVQSIALLAHLAEVRDFNKLCGIFICPPPPHVLAHKHPTSLCTCILLKSPTEWLTWLTHCCESPIRRSDGLITPKGEKVEFRGNTCFHWQEDARRVSPLHPVIWVLTHARTHTHTHTHTRAPVVAADDVFSSLFPHRETTSGARSWSSPLHPRSTTGTRSSPALCPNSRWERTKRKHLRKHVRRNPWHPRLCRPRLRTERMKPVWD